ncbi:MAG TPA: hypothetical protein VKZ94_11950, partial [Advenella sp.]|nr:hypothetical protein [Advenella sp.]
KTKGGCPEFMYIRCARACAAVWCPAMALLCAEANDDDRQRAHVNIVLAHVCRVIDLRSCLLLRPPNAVGTVK